jgi:hypothetical protein
MNVLALVFCLNLTELLDLKYLDIKINQERQEGGCGEP